MTKRQYFSLAENVPVTTYDGGVMVVNMNMRGSWIRCNIIERKIPDSQRAKDMV